MGQVRRGLILSRRLGFTLIELLIVVAIIAILAAIAVPNFLEAQTRAKVSRTLADMRTMRTALESYAVDTNKYPETDAGLLALQSQQAQFRVYSVYRLTTPIAYLTSLTSSPFQEKHGTGNPSDPKLASLYKGYLYVNKINSRFDGGAGAVGENYMLDRWSYVLQGALSSIADRQKGEWLIKSVGPDNIDNRDTTVTGLPATSARFYDPTNGTVSAGDIVIFSDLAGTGKL